jgi:hypothetical protein
MKRRAGSPPEEASQVEWRRSNCSRHVIERDAVRHSAGQISLGRLNMVGVIGFRTFPASFTRRRRQSLSRKRGFQRVGDDLKRRHFNPQWIRRRQRRFHLIVFYNPQPLRQFAMPPEYAGSAWASDKGKRPFRMIVNGGIEFANYIIQYSWRWDEDRSAITAIGRVADAICRFLRKEDRLIDVGSHTSTAKVLFECAVTQQDDLVGVRLFLISGGAASGATAVIAHSDKRTVVKRTEREQIF